MHGTAHLKDLENNTWFSALPQRFKTLLLEHARYLRLDKQQSIFHAGDPFNGLYAVLDGAVRLGYIDLEGKEAIAAIAEPFMWFGEISLIDTRPRSHDAITIQKSVILHIPGTNIQHLLQTNPELWYHLAQLATHKLRYAFRELIAIHTQPLTQRLAQRLLFILNGYGNHLHIENNVIHLSQEQLAQMLMCSRQTINQELHLLEKKGLLKVSFRKIEVLEIEKLTEAANGIIQLSSG
ncbi:Crp/Fnr family transcriptional regulator [Acinetobacter sp. WZC-1]|uniref:Crp/Fnr family transcriptional regulator n=1 Tax=Acinetobacter sp. WZC-1 TaxID=3459034 RepID=UPI00403E1BBA